MINLNTEQLADLTRRVNERLDEFGVAMMPNMTNLSRGVVRIVADVIEEWWVEVEAELVTDYQNARVEMYERGYAAALRAVEADRIAANSLEPSIRDVTEPTAYLNGEPTTSVSAATSDDFAEFEAAWPTLPDLDGVDLFAEHGQPTGTPAELDAAIEHELERIDDALACGGTEAIPTPLDGLQIIAPPPLPAPATNGRLAAALRKPRTMAEVERTAQLKADLEAIIAFIRDLSVHGRMPSQLEYQVKRPKYLPSWITITKRYEVVTWRQMAELCGLDYDAAQLSHARIVEVEDDPYMPDGLDDADDDADLLDDDDFDDSDDAPAKRKKPAGKREKRERLTRSQEFSRPGPEPKHSVTQPTLEQLITELQRQAMGNVMVTQAAFNLAKPAVWGSATAQVTRFGLSWEQLREEAGLKPNPRWARTWQQADAAA